MPACLPAAACPQLAQRNQQLADARQEIQLLQSQLEGRVQQQQQGEEEDQGLQQQQQQQAVLQV
jgi:hypothetical protein